MAESARIMLWLTGGQIALGVAGTVAVLAALIYTARSTQAASIAAEAALDANKLNREAVIADQRPWIAVRKCEPAGPLTWKDGDCIFKVCVTLENVGRTPALNTAVVLTPYALLEEDDLQFLQKETASTILPHRLVFGMTIFPGKKEEIVKEVILDQIHIDKTTALRHASTVHIAVVGLINYYSYASKETYQTPIIFDVRRASRDGFTERIGIEYLPVHAIRFFDWPQPGITR